MQFEIRTDLAVERKEEFEDKAKKNLRRILKRVVSGGEPDETD